MNASTSGYCIRCEAVHSLPVGQAEFHCHILMETLQQKKRVDYSVCQREADPHFSTAYLYGDARGQMFGVLVCLDRNGHEKVLKAFSGQYNGVWQVDGWAPPLFDVEKFYLINNDRDKEIKKLTRLINQCRPATEEQKALISERKKLSRQLMKNIHALYEVTNFRGQTKGLYDIFIGQSGMPTGTGDCCAPKLLNQAAKNGLTPLGLAEFYWGFENKSQSKQHGHFYGSCEDKCQPILGFMLCGV